MDSFDLIDHIHVQNCVGQNDSVLSPVAGTGPITGIACSRIRESDQPGGVQSQWIKTK